MHFQGDWIFSSAKERTRYYEITALNATTLDTWWRNESVRELGVI